MTLVTGNVIQEIPNKCGVYFSETLTRSWGTGYMETMGGPLYLVPIFVAAPADDRHQLALREGGDEVRRCGGGWASGVLGAVDRWLSGSASHSRAQAVIAQTLRDAVPERALQIDADVGR